MEAIPQNGPKFLLEEILRIKFSQPHLRIQADPRTEHPKNHPCSQFSAKPGKLLPMEFPENQEEALE